MTNTRNTLTINETKEILCTEHAGRLFISECWWALVPGGDNNPMSWNSSGDASAFWALVDAVQSMGQPIGYNKVTDRMGKPVSVPHNDVEQLLRKFIKPNVKTGKPVMAVSQIRAKYGNFSAEQYHAERMAEYNAAIEADQQRIDSIVKTIMTSHQFLNPEEQEALGGDLVHQEEVYNEDGDIVDYQDVYIEGGEWNIPIDRIISFGEKQIAYLANLKDENGNLKVPDIFFGAEATLWEDEIKTLKRIVQAEDTTERQGLGSAALDNALLSADSMRAGTQAGK